MSLGKHDPPQPGPGWRNREPIRWSEPNPRVTASMSAPTASQTAASPLTNETLVARKELVAYLMVSAEAGSTATIGASIES